jgi:enoyl-CoA hydratase
MTVDYSRYREITAQRKDRILTLTFNRPAQYNAVNHELHEELSDIFYDIAKDEETNVVVLTGAGKAFCAGGDLRAMKEHATTTEVRAIISRGLARSGLSIRCSTSSSRSSRR